MQFHNGVTKFREDQRDRAPNLFTIYQLGCWSTNVRVFESCSFSKSLGPVVDQIPLNSYIIRIEWTAENRKNEPSTFRICALDDGQISFRGYIFSVTVTLLIVFFSVLDRRRHLVGKNDYSYVENEFVRDVWFCVINPLASGSLFRLFELF